METINFTDLLEQSKKRFILDYKPIKRMSLYNYLNDSIPTIIIDCRIEAEESQLKEGGQIRDSNTLEKFQNNISTIKTGSRLILILDNEEDLKKRKDLEFLRIYIQNEDKIEKGIFVITNSNYQDFLKDYSCLLVNESSELIERQLACTSFPLIVLDKIIYIGNFFNSKNLFQLKHLKIMSIISFLGEEDKDLKKMFPNYHFFQVDEENHSEVEFLDVIDLIESEKEAKNIPILIYCFSGQSISIAACIAYLMKNKKWSIEFATGYMMKICPQFKVPTWLYTQLQRLDIKKIQTGGSKKLEVKNTDNDL